MSRFITSLRFLLAGVVLILVASKPAAAQDYYDDGYGGQASYQQFYDELSPYGEWVNDPQYGYVWVPDAGDDFRPYYSNGYWVNSTYGNTWVSNYNWGWAPFHYGRWTYSNYYGWLWIPGSEWGPAWVSWRSGGGSYGWAPMGPGISINIAIGGGYYAPDYWWNFTPQQYILSPNFQNYCYGPRYNQRYVQQTTIINNTYVYNNRTYITGPRRNELERATGRPVQQVAINNSRRPDRAQLRGNELSIYRPAIAESPRATERPRTFATSRQPIAETQRATRNGSMVAPDRNVSAAQQPAATQGSRSIFRPDRTREEISQQPTRSPRFEQAAPNTVAQPSPDRSRRFEQQPQIQRSEQVQPSRNWGANPDYRTPDRAPMQQQQAPPVQQRQDRVQIDRNMEVVRAQQQAQQVQRQQQIEMAQRQQQQMEQAQRQRQMESAQRQQQVERAQRQMAMERAQQAPRAYEPRPDVQRQMPQQQAPTRMERQQPVMEQRQQASPRQEAPTRMERPAGGRDGRIFGR